MGLLNKLFSCGKNGNSSIVKDLILTLKTGAETERRNAVIQLKRHPCDAVVKAFSEALKDWSHEVIKCASEGLCVIAARGGYRIDPKPLLEALGTQPKSANLSLANLDLKTCLRLLGLQEEVDKIMEQQFPTAAKYTISCMPFLCPQDGCGFQIVKVPSWPALGNSVGFYAQRDMYRTGAYYIELVCPSCSKIVYVVWDEDPR